MDEQQDNYNSDLVYDLRQYFAKIVGEHMIEIAIARKERNFSEWVKLLECLHTEIRKKLTDDEEKEYQEKLSAMATILNEKEQVFNGTSTEKDDYAVVFNTINDLDMWLGIRMEEHGMFGRKEEDGL